MKSISNTRDKSQSQVEELRELCHALESDASALGKIVKGVKELIAGEQFEGAAEVIRRVVRPSLDYTAMQGLGKLFRGVRGKGEPSGTKIKLAVLSSFTSH